MTSSDADDKDGKGGIQEVIEALTRLSPAEEQEFIAELKSHDQDEKIKDYDGVVDGLKDAFILMKLQQEIEAQKRLIQNLVLANPSQSHEAESKGRATTQKSIHNKHYMMTVEQLKKLSDLYDNKFLIVEKGRVADVVQEHRESHPLNTEACPICLEEIPITDNKSVLYLGCCGNFMCYQCVQANCAGGQIRMKNCPLCREEIFVELEKQVSQIELLAKRGRAWAQNTMGIYCSQGSSCEHGKAKLT